MTNPKYVCEECGTNEVEAEGDICDECFYQNAAEEDEDMDEEDEDE